MITYFVFSYRIIAKMDVCSWKSCWSWKCAQSFQCWDALISPERIRESFNSYFGTEQSLSGSALGCSTLDPLKGALWFMKRRWLYACFTQTNAQLQLEVRMIRFNDIGYFRIHYDLSHHCHYHLIFWGTVGYLLWWRRRWIGRGTASTAGARFTWWGSGAGIRSNLPKFCQNLATSGKMGQILQHFAKFCRARSRRYRSCFLQKSFRFDSFCSNFQDLQDYALLHRSKFKIQQNFGEQIAILVHIQETFGKSANCNMNCCQTFILANLWKFS